MSTLVDGLTRVLDVTGELVDTSARLGVATGALQELRFAASQSGVGADQLDAALTKVQTKLGAFKGGDDAAVKTFESLGLAGDITSGKLQSADQVLVAFADKLRAMNDPALAAAAAAELLGDKAGPKLVGFLSQGSAAILRLQEDARKLGVVLSDDLLQAAADAGDKLDSLSRVIGTKVTVEIAKLAPQIVEIADTLTASLPAIASWGEGITQSVSGALQGLSAFTGAIKSGDYAQAIKLLGEGIVEVSAIGGVRDLLGFGEEAEAATAEVDKLSFSISVLQERIANAQATGQAGLVEQFQEDLRRLEVQRAKLQRDAEARRKFDAPATTPVLAITRGNLDTSGAVANEEMLRRATAIYDDTRTASERYATKVKELDELLRADAISLDTYKRAIAEARVELERLTKTTSTVKPLPPPPARPPFAGQPPVPVAKPAAPVPDARFDRTGGSIFDGMTRITPEAEEAKKSLAEIGDELVRANAYGESFTYGLIDGLTTAAQTGKLSISDMTASILADFQRIAIQQAILGFVGAAFGGPTTAATGAYANARPNSQSARGFVTGGSFMVAGRAGRDTNLVQFMATQGERVTVDRPNGDPMSGDGPLHGFARGGQFMVGGKPSREREMADANVAAVSAPAPTFVINDQRGASAPEIERREKPGPGGSRDVELFIGREVQRQLGTGKTDRVMGQRYGLKPQPR